MKKTYIQPTMELIPFCSTSALCASPTTVVTGPGGNPWEDGRAPKRTIFF